MFRRMLARQILKRFSGGKIEKPGRIQAVMRMPVLLRLGYALFRDSRVPFWMRSSTALLLLVAFSPIDLPGNVPILGELWDFTLGVVILETFIRMAPSRVVNEHISRLGIEKKVPLRPD